MWIRKCTEKPEIDHVWFIICLNIHEAKIAEIKQFPGHLRCSNIYDDMHKLWIGECLTGAKSVPKHNLLACIY